MGKLTDKAIQAAQSKEKQYSIADGEGLSLIVRPNGVKFWWFRYRYGGKAKTLSIGTYPLISLKDAREKTFDARKKLANNIDPSAKKIAERAAIIEERNLVERNSDSEFEKIAREWYEKHRQSLGWEDNHASKILGRLENDIFPWLNDGHLINSSLHY